MRSALRIAVYVCLLTGILWFRLPSANLSTINADESRNLRSSSLQLSKEKTEPKAILQGKQQVEGKVLHVQVERLQVSSAGMEIPATATEGCDPGEIRRVEIEVRGTAQIAGVLDSSAFPQADVWLIAPAGIEFSEGAELAVRQSFLATTGSRTGSGFRFTEQGVGTIVNRGRLEVGAEKSLALVGGRLEQRGTLRAPGGKLVLAAPVKTEGSGSRVQGSGFENQETKLDAEVLARLSFERPQQGGNAGLLEQCGTLDVTGDQAGTITIQAGLGFVGGSLNANGTDTGGKIALQGERLIVTGHLEANGWEGNGGKVNVETTIRTIQTALSTVTASGGRFGTGGTIAVQGGFDRMDAGVYLAGKLAAGTLGKQGGEITVQGRKLDLVDAKLAAVGPTGGGKIALGNHLPLEEKQAVRSVYVSETSELIANASRSGNGGDIRVWSGTDTEMRGTVSAAGGIRGGEGGQVEVSGLGRVTMDGMPATSAGKPGRLLLDPKNIVIDNTSGTFPQLSLVDPNAGGGTGFGTTVTALGNGNLVVTKPNDTTGGTAAGAVYLFNSLTGALISALTGSAANNSVGSLGITVLTNGNYVVSSPLWDNGATTDVGAVTWCNPATGINGVVSVSNSLTGSTAGDQVGFTDASSSSIVTLPNGNYVVLSNKWDNGAATNAGAVTWCNGTTTFSGTVSPANSLVGTTANDQAATNVTVLQNGNYVVRNPVWDNGAVVNAGAVTWANGTTGITGAISTANSLVGSVANDTVGSGGVFNLPNGNYVVTSPNWDNGAAVDAGAATWANGTTGLTGVVSPANSLVGSRNSDLVGVDGVVTIPTGNYLVVSTRWSAGPTALTVGAVTWANGTTGITGPVSASNSLVGSTSADRIGEQGVVVLTNNNYVVSSGLWNNGTSTDAGAVTWGNGATGISGAISAANSLVGTGAFNQVGLRGATPLTNGNYVVVSQGWDNGAVANVGAVTWANGTTGITGPVTTANSLVGSSNADSVGSTGVTALSNGNYVVGSLDWDNAGVVGAGAVTWGNGSTGITGTVSAANSLVGSTAGDVVGSSIVALSNGNYVVLSGQWDNGAAVDAGAVTWGNGTTGITGPVSAANSLVGTTASDFVGGANRVTALPNGNYVVSSPTWDNGAVANAGAVTWGNGTTGTFGAVTPFNSLVGTTASDAVGGFLGVSILQNGNVVVRNVNWNNGGLANAGAFTWMSGTTGQSLTGFGAVSINNSIVGTVASAGSVDRAAANETVNGTFAVVFANDPTSGRVTLGLSNPNPNQLTYNRWQGGTTSITTSFLTNLLNLGTAVTLQANNDITLNSPLSTTGSGNLTLQAGRSVLLNQAITLDGGNLTVIANDQLANGVVDAQRDAGAAVITATGAISTGSGTATFDLRNGAGKTNPTSGNIQLLTVQAGGISLTNNGPTAGSRIRVTGTLASGACTGASLCSAGGSGGITINHPNSGADFLVGNAATNGTAGSIVTATATIPTPTTIVNAPGTFTQGNISVTPGQAPCPAITVNPTTLPNAMQGVPYSQVITASPAASYNFSVPGGGLPIGISLTGGGGMAGTPNVPGVYTFTIQATNVSTNCTGSRSYTLTVLARPTITAAAPLTRQQGSPNLISQIATVSDAETPAANLTVTTTSVPAGLSVTAITNVNGAIEATISASCTATVGSNIVGLQVTDGDGQTATANLTVNVTANTQPVLTYNTVSVGLSGGRTVTPATGPTDNGSVATVAIQSQGTYTGTISVNGAGAVTFANAAPLGTHTITVRATDNCGLTTDASLQVTVATPAHTMTQFYPVAATTGKTVTISGTGFVTGQTEVFFGEGRLIPATITALTPTSLSVTVPASSNGTGNINGYLTVRVGGIDVTTETLPANAPDPGNPAAVFPEFILWGDVNRDGVFATNDVTLARAFLIFQATPTTRQSISVDVVPLNGNGSRGNGQLTSTDFSLLRAVLAGQTTF